MNRFQAETRASEAHCKVARAAVEKLASIRESSFFRHVASQDSFEEYQKIGGSLQSFAHLGVLGIGGSSLGPKAIRDFFGAQEKLIVLENVDPVSFRRQTEKLPLESIHWLVISKSGKTIETLTQLTLLVALYEAKGLWISKHFTVLADPAVEAGPESPLVIWAKQNSVRHVPIPGDLGGRYSVLGPVGMIPAAYLGLSPMSFRKGALEVQAEPDLISSFVAQALESFERQEWITVFWSYSDLLGSFGGWIQQLWAESLSKAKDRKGQVAPRVSTPLPLLGANDQHSILQQLMDGASDKWICFIGIDEVEGTKLPMQNLIGLPEYLENRSLGEVLRAERLATAQALSQVGRSTAQLQLENVSACSLGRAFMFFECAVAAIAEALDINAFDQPGVELGKRLAQEMLSKTHSS